MTGPTLRTRRTKARISLRALAAYLGMSPSYLSDLELGRRTSRLAIERAAAGLRAMVLERKGGR